MDMRVQLSTTTVRPDHHITLAECTPRLVQAFEGRDLPGRLAAIRELIDHRVVFTTSFGLEDQVITHAIFTQNLAIDAVTLDTGRLFLQTYDLWAETERRYGQRIRAHYPDQLQLEALIEHQGINGFRKSIDARHACCGVRKVEPLGRALAGAAVWITGLRAGQSQARGETPAAEVDKTYGLVKANPLFDWSRENVAVYARKHDVPVNPLHQEGFLSIGCASCTRAVKPGEPERAGRWWWEADDEKECGLHEHVRSAAPASASAAAALAPSAAGC